MKKSHALDPSGLRNGDGSNALASAAFDVLDRQPMHCQLMRMSSAEAIKKLQSLSEERAGKVCALIEDLAELEALENAADLKDDREALAEVEAARTPLFANTKTAACEKPAEPATIPYEQLRREVGLDR